MDISMEGCGGIEALRRIIQFDPQARILIYTVHASDAMLYRALDMGALGYVTKASDIDTLISGIREVARQRGFISPDMIPAMVRKHTTHNQYSLLEQLGKREFQILSDRPGPQGWGMRAAAQSEREDRAQPPDPDQGQAERHRHGGTDPSGDPGRPGRALNH